MSTQTANGHRPTRRQPPGERVPPHNVEAEEAVLGAALLDAGALRWLLANLRPEHFYRGAHRTVLATIAQLDRDGAPVDATSLVEALRVQDLLAEVGGATAVHALIEAVPTVSNAGYYGRIVADLATLRRLIDTGARIMQLGHEAPQDPERAKAAARLLVEELCRDGEEIGLRPPDLLDAIRERQRAKATGRFATWGIGSLDLLSDGGLPPGDLVLLAALPSVGKSSLSIQVATHNAEAGHVLYVTYEMTAANTGKHTFALVGGHTLAESEARVDDPALAGIRRLHNELDLTVFRHQPDAARLLDEVRALHARRPLRLVVVDYLQKVPPAPGRRYGTREQEVSEVSRLLKATATLCDVPVLACCQLNRGAHGRRPVLADLRESGSLEQDADGVLFLHRPEDDARVVEAILAKHRMGPTGDTRLAWLAKQAMFADV